MGDVDRVNDVQIWYAGDARVFAEWITLHTDLKDRDPVFKELAESDANKPRHFFRMPARIRDILYLDAPDLIVSVNNVPILSIEISTEAGTGHNAFQRFSRLAAAVERGVPALYIYPEAVWVKRRDSNPRWDRINPLIFKTLCRVSQIFEVPAFLYFYPTEFRLGSPKAPTKGTLPKGLKHDPNPKFPGVPDPGSPDMRSLFEHVNGILELSDRHGPRHAGRASLSTGWAESWLRRMDDYWKANGSPIEATMSPLSSTIEVATSTLLEHLEIYADRRHDFGELLPSREKTIIYHPTGKYRNQGDPYTGSLAAIDYLWCRTGPTYEDRDKNLAVAFGSIHESGGELRIEGPASVTDFVTPIRDMYSSEARVLLNKEYGDFRGAIPRYMMQVRHGTTYTKRKDLRIYSYFCDVLLFKDGALWREA